MAHRSGICLHMYLYDWVIRHQSRHLLEVHRDKLMCLCHRLGLLVNLEKSDLSSSQDFVFVGYRYVTQRGLVFPSEERIAKLRTLLRVFLSGEPQSALRWQSMLGLLAASEKLVPFGRLHMRELQFDLN